MLDLDLFRSLVSAGLSDHDLEQTWIEFGGERDVLDAVVAEAQEQRARLSHARGSMGAHRSGRQPAARGPLDHRRLFLATVEDVWRRANEPYEEFETLLLSVGLRKLLLDSPRLTDLVNRPHGLKLSFRFVTGGRGAVDRDGGPSMVVHVDMLDAFHIGEPIAETGRDRFLAEPIILQREGPDFTVRDVISHCANVAGGVHAGSPKDDRLQALDDAVRYLPVGDMTGVIRLLPPIGRVVARALEPLGQAVRRELGD